MTKKGNNRNFGLFNSLFRYAPQRIEQSKNYLQKVVIHYCEKLAICNCEKLTILNLLFTGTYLIFAKKESLSQSRFQAGISASAGEESPPKKKVYLRTIVCVGLQSGVF